MSKIIKIALIASLAATTSFAKAQSNQEQFFWKTPLTSVHFGQTEGYQYNTQNLGIGFGYEHTTTVPTLGRTRLAYSLALFSDSFGCEAANAQLRVLKRFDSVALGVSINLAHKCRDSSKQIETFIAPLFSATWNLTKSVRIALEGGPPISKKYSVGFICISLDRGF